MARLMDIFHRAIGIHLITNRQHLRSHTLCKILQIQYRSRLEQQLQTHGPDCKHLRTQAPQHLAGDSKEHTSHSRERVRRRRLGMEFLFLPAASRLMETVSAVPVEEAPWILCKLQ